MAATQTGFVPGRFIQENLTFTRDVVEWANETANPVIIAFLDYEKAFDRVNWEYRNHLVMQRMDGLPSIYYFYDQRLV